MYCGNGAGKAGGERTGVDGVESRDDFGRNGDWRHGPVRPVATILPLTGELKKAVIGSLRQVRKHLWKYEIGGLGLGPEGRGSQKPGQRVGAVVGDRKPLRALRKVSDLIGVVCGED